MCPKYDIQSMPSQSNICVKKNDKNYVYYPCALKDNYCKFEFNQEITCSQIQKIKKFPGVACTDKEECLSGICQNNICFGQKENFNCNEVQDCELGLTCFNYICVKPKLEGSDCKSDSDCQTNCGCLNNKCTRYFSLPDKTTVSSSNSNQNIPDKEGKRFCQSFFVHNSKCETFTNYYYYHNTIATESASEPCFYRNKYSELFKLTNRQCGIDGKAYCPIGNGEEAFENYLTLLKVYLINNTNCHQAEKFNFPCQNDLAKTEKNNIDYRRAQTLLEAESVLKQHQFNTNNLIALQLKYNIAYDKTVELLDFDCPHFRCYSKSENNNKCLQSFTTNNSTGYFIEVKLSHEICLENEYCSVDGANPEMLMFDKDIAGYCAPISNYFFPFRYPGEDCNKDMDCYLFNRQLGIGFCDLKTNKCSGFQENIFCNKHEECNAGLYCDFKSKTCTKQKDVGNACVSSYDCLNHLLCYHNKCEDKLYSFKANELIEVDPSDSIPWEKYCQFETRYDNVCIELKGFDTIDMSIHSKNEQCEYKTSIADYSVMKKSRCGYNDKGLGYCPIGHNIDKDIWLKYYKAKARKYDNKCHTLNRYNCYLSNKHALTDIAFYSHYLDKGHWYYNSVNCAIDVLSSNYISSTISLLVTSILVLLL